MRNIGGFISRTAWRKILNNNECLCFTSHNLFSRITLVSNTEWHNFELIQLYQFCWRGQTAKRYGTKIPSLVPDYSVHIVSTSHQTHNPKHQERVLLSMCPLLKWDKCLLYTVTERFQQDWMENAQFQQRHVQMHLENVNVVKKFSTVVNFTM